MMHRQSGITALGFLIVAAFMGMFLLAGIKLVPVYMEYGKIQATLEKVRDEFKGERPTPEQIRNSIEARFNIEYVNSIAASDVEITRTAAGYNIRAAYEGRVTYLGNLNLVADFDTSVEIAR